MVISQISSLVFNILSEFEDIDAYLYNHDLVNFSNLRIIMDF